MLKFTNNASATLAGAITASATSVILTPGNGALFPALGAGEFCFATLVDSSNNLEIVKVTGRSADTLTVVRAQDNTTARAYGVGDKLELRLVAAVFSEMIQRDGSVAMTAALNLGGFKATSMAEPAVATDGATKNYADTIMAAEVTARNNAVSSEATARTNADALKADKTGGNASGTWPISVSGTAAGVAWTGVSGRPTALSQFSNDLGNYGGFVNAGIAGQSGGAQTAVGNCGNITAANCGWVNVNKSGTSLSAQFITGVNCVNCNCNCACSTTCCFPLDTLLTLADGSKKKVQDFVAGDKVRTTFGDTSNVLEPIVCGVVAGEVTVMLNKTVRMTREHLVRGASGWLAVDKEFYVEWLAGKKESIQDIGVDLNTLRQLKVGDEVQTDEGLVTIDCIERFVATESETLMSVELDGDRTFFANGFAVESKTSKE